MPKGLIQLNKQ